MLFQSTPYAFMKLFRISGVNIKAFGKLKTAWNADAALVSRVSRLRLSTLASACTFLTEQRARVRTPITKSEEKERLLAVYLQPGMTMLSVTRP